MLERACRFVSPDTSALALGNLTRRQEWSAPRDQSSRSFAATERFSMKTRFRRYKGHEDFLLIRDFL